MRRASASTGLAHGGTAPGQADLKDIRADGRTLTRPPSSWRCQWSQECIGETKLDLSAKRQAEIISVLYDVLVDAMEAAGIQGGDPAAIAKADLSRRLARLNGRDRPGWFVCVGRRRIAAKGGSRSGTIGQLNLLD